MFCLYCTQIDSDIQKQLHNNHILELEVAQILPNETRIMITRCAGLKELFIRDNMLAGLNSGDTAVPGYIRSLIRHAIARRKRTTERAEQAEAAGYDEPTPKCTDLFLVSGNRQIQYILGYPDLTKACKLS